jgi:small subunit ribosomal protein S17
MPKKVLKGIVVSNKMDKTVVVKVDRLVSHPLYKKRFTRSRKFKAHDPENKCNLGDIVLIQESRPISKEKHWQVIKILDQGGSQ